jgi:hypothetical protein
VDLLPSAEEMLQPGDAGCLHSAVSEGLLRPAPEHSAPQLMGTKGQRRPEGKVALLAQRVTRRSASPPAPERVSTIESFATRTTIKLSVRVVDGCTTVDVSMVRLCCWPRNSVGLFRQEDLVGCAEMTGQCEHAWRQPAAAQPDGRHTVLPREAPCRSVTGKLSG